MSTTREKLTTPVVLPDGFGVIVLAGDCGLLAGAVALLLDVQSGKVPLAAARQYVAPGRLTELRDAFAGAARDQQRAKHREIAKVASAQPQQPSTLVAPCQPAASSSPATYTVLQAAEQLGLSRQRVTLLCSTGRIQAVRGSRQVWEIDPRSVAAYARSARRRRTRAHGQRHEGSTEAEPGAAA